MDASTDMLSVVLLDLSCLGYCTRVHSQFYDLVNPAMACFIGAFTNLREWAREGLCKYVENMGNGVLCMITRGYNSVIRMLNI